MHSLTTNTGAHAFISESAKINTSWPEVRCVTIPANANEGILMDIYAGAAAEVEGLFKERHIHFTCTAHKADEETLRIPAAEAAQAIKLLMNRNRELEKAGSKKSAIEPELAEAVTDAMKH